MKSAAPVPEESGIFQVTMSRNDPPFETNKAGRDRCIVWKDMFSVFHRLNDRHQDITKNSTGEQIYIT